MTTSTLRASTLSVSSLSASTTTTSSLTSGTIAVNSFSASTLTGSSLTASTITVSTLGYSTLSGSTISVQNISLSTLSGSSIITSAMGYSSLIGSSITTNFMGYSSITGSTINTNAMGYSSLTGSSIITSAMGYSTLSGSTIAAQNITLSSLTVSSINNAAPASGWSTSTGGGAYYTTGNIGIGTEVPADKLSLYSLTNLSFRMSNTNAGYFQIGLANGGGEYSGQSIAGDSVLRAISGNMILQSGSGNAAIYINSSNNVGIGTNNPGSKFVVYHSANSQFSVFNGGTDIIGSDVVGTSLGVSFSSNNSGTSTYGTTTYGRFGRLTVNYNTAQGGTGQASFWRDWGIDKNGSLFFTLNQSTTQGITLTGTGSVGIGSSSPVGLLDVYGANPTLRIKTSTAAYLSGFASLLFDTNTASYPLAQITATDVGVSPSIYQGILQFWTQYNGTLVERMRISSTGFVGIGTAAPSNPLHVYSGNASPILMEQSGTNPNYITFRSNGTVYGYFGLENDAGGGLFGSNTAYGMAIGTRIATNFNISTNNLTRMTVAANGNVGIGITTPTSNLHVIGTIFASGDITALSDQRYKQNIVRLDHSLDMIRSINGYSYTRQDYRPGEKQIGLLAQELSKVLPEAVSYDSNNDQYSINYNSLIAPLVEAVKELYDRVELQSKMIDKQQLLIQQLLSRA